MGYFNQVKNLEELRKQYKDLLKQHHPDNGGDVAIMQAINAEYDKLFQALKDKHRDSMAADGDETATKQSDFDFAADEKLREVLQAIIGFTGITIDLIGSWIWLDGNTYPYREALKAIGFRWNGKRKKWSWHSGEYHKHGNSQLTYEEIQNLYGSTKFKTRQRTLLPA